MSSGCCTACDAWAARLLGCRRLCVCLTRLIRGLIVSTLSCRHARRGAPLGAAGHAAGKLLFTGTMLHLQKVDERGAVQLPMWCWLDGNGNASFNSTVCAPSCRARRSGTRCSCAQRRRCGPNAFRYLSDLLCLKRRLLHGFPGWRLRCAMWRPAVCCITAMHAALCCGAGGRNDSHGGGGG